MFRVRPIEHRDFDTLHAIAVESGAGFTSLPDDPTLLRRKIENSIETLARPDTAPGPETYLFVLEATDSGEVVGTCGITAAVGLDMPFYHYHVGTLVHSSRELEIYNEFKVLNLCNDYTGSSELCTLYLRPDVRQGGLGRLLSKSRFLFIAQHPGRFDDRVIAEMRGFTDESGSNPFWEGLGRRFFSMDYDRADYLTGSGNKVFVAELMPRHSIYIHLLPESAQAIIGRVHPNTEPACRMLESEGFRFEDYIDIFDAGPTLAARRSDIRAIRDCHTYEVKISTAGQAEPGPLYLVANGRTLGFRCISAQVQLGAKQVSLSPTEARALEITEGDRVACVPLNP
ncbi:arginine N-succinyltransferase [Marinobacterium litorale]|uniref:arginine N-succinyltransferase n=1 Tax=Marinobacterium litorale TaxID=404770 RepID=UPI00042178AC|nr:arginine N-succinyltransferase [Marinobacterium litorale]